METTIGRQPVDLCTIQLSSLEHNWVIDVLSLSSVQPIAPLLASPDIIKIIHNASFERRVFSGYGISINAIVDTLVQSRRIRGMQVGTHKLGDVAERELGLKLDKCMQKADWAERPLTDRHLNYAALDTEVLIDLHKIFEAHSR